MEREKLIKLIEQKRIRIKKIIKWNIFIKARIAKEKQ